MQRKKPLAAEPYRRMVRSRGSRWKGGSPLLRSECRRRAILTKDTTPTGDVAVHLAGDTGLKSRLASARLRGARDDTVHFGVTGRQATLPEGQYNLDRGTIE